MKAIFHVSIFLSLLIGGYAAASEPKKNPSTPASEPTKCYEGAWGSKESEGFGLTAGQAITLCRGTTNANKVLQCFSKAWAHPNNGGLGLSAGQAIDLCKTIFLE